MSELSRAARYTQALVRCASVTPAEGGALSLIEGWLKPYGFEIDRPVFQTPGSYAVENLYARLGSGEPCLVFAGHTDVVPTGDEARWTHPPFSGAVFEGEIWGRGAQDMKAGVAASIAAVLDHLDTHGAPKGGSIAFLITGDEEADAYDGTVKLLEWAKARGEVFSACVLGEPTNPDVMGEMMKIGRRGSMTCWFTATGVQGHSAYPHRAKNPMSALVRLLARLEEKPLDEGTAHFDASTLAITTIDCGNPATNVIPARGAATVNIRFNDLHSGASLSEWLSAHAAAVQAETGVQIDCRFQISGESFLTPPGELSELIASAVQAETGRRPEPSTSGGTSDARFVKAHCPVVEFGLVGKTMHQVDERVEVAQIGQLKAIYARILRDYFA